MAGVRIHHPTLRSCTFIIWEAEHTSTGSQGGIRKAKKRPLMIDDNGDTVVSETVWRRLEEAYAAGRTQERFIVLNEVPDPPKLQIGNVSSSNEPMPTFEAQVGDAIRQIAPGVSSVSIAPSNKVKTNIRTK